MKSQKLFSLILTLCVLLQLTGCVTGKKVIYTGTDFDPLIDQMFLDEVKNDSVTLNYTLARPENYGIKEFTPTLGSYSQKNMKRGHKAAKQYIKKLEQFDYDTLSTEQKKNYDIILKYLKEQAHSDKLNLYNEVLSPTTGLQAQLPVLLAEFHFLDKKDIENYISCLNQMKDYYSQIIAFEKEKSKAGLFMSDTSANAIISQCKDFIKNPEENFLITLFNHRMDSYTALSETEKQTYKQQNKEAVLQSVIPAYQLLIKELTNLKGTGKNNGGLCHFKHGKEYYKYLVKTNTGSDRPIKAIDTLLDETISDCLKNIGVIISADPDMQTKLDQYYYPLTDPEEILSYLQRAIEVDFPKLKEVNCMVKTVDKSLEEHISPAFYLTPQLDNCKNNCIYINKSKKYDLSQIFPTIAHEGYPGHLYQNCYYSQKNAKPIRYLLNFDGYSEGWATYVEMYSYSIAGLDDAVAKVLAYNQIATLCIYAKCDININYYGWDLNTTTSYLKTFGFTDKNISKQIHESMIEEPCNYLKYTLGYLELTALKKKAKEKLGDKFSALAFHQFVLDMGPCQFKVLEKYMDKWIKEQI
ncbi:DUF885 domain-containing protein [[Clostridium] polysaccharolyticum]|uniref:Uncharacterized conserved protein, DUF885 familyt n=1 Tax=[Clostridium] polysaccharolyticum TaxID=29364 RepID=A0A1I0ESI7_9FIRM|nr:DUF885 domain-containing protein [[Clostridium] polysaccharolyticum]SET47792.1 Uncharacterized conserved protein, DUF885 familyt [[Clostridium] polysaccharolyticum]